MDFGCYGANLITWLMKGEKPESVVAVAQQLKPAIYTRVDDEATIVVTYPKAQGIIQASWNWPYNRKDMEIYGQHAYLKADKNTLVFREGDDPEENKSFRTLPYNDPFNFLAAVVRGKVTVSETDLSSLPLNLTAMEILDAARQSVNSASCTLSRARGPEPNARGYDLGSMRAIAISTSGAGRLVIPSAKKRNSQPARSACLLTYHLRAGTSPNSSNRDGRKSKAILRTR